MSGGSGGREPPGKPSLSKVCCQPMPVPGSSWGSCVCGHGRPRERMRLRLRAPAAHNVLPARLQLRLRLRLMQPMPCVMEKHTGAGNIKVTPRCVRFTSKIKKSEPFFILRFVFSFRS